MKLYDGWRRSTFKIKIPDRTNPAIQNKKWTDEHLKTDCLSPMTGNVHVYLLISPLSFQFPQPPTPSHFALIQLCICILNDSITWDPVVKITDVFHYFSLSSGTAWPLPATNHPPPLPSIPLSCPHSPPVLFSSSSYFPLPQKMFTLFCMSICDGGNNS